MPIDEMRAMNTRTRIGLVAAAAAMLGAPALAAAAEYARVLSATPVTESVAVPRQECVHSEQLVQQPPSGAGAVVGAIAGGVVGNQFGHGFGRAAATGIGAVAGSAIGNNVEANANPPTAVPVQRCRTVDAQESRVVGYDVVYEYHGQRYSTRLPQDPGPSLAVDIRPAGSAPAGERGAPPVTYGAVPPAYAETAPVVSDPTPITYTYASPPPAYYPAAPIVYPAPYYYAAPAIGFGIGYWAGRAWHGGHSHGGHWHGGYGRGGYRGR
jgi:uncharacterized protein YcfJ